MDTYYDDISDDFYSGNENSTVAWQENEGGRWSKTHSTRDHGRTTLCGAKVPTVNWMSDAWSAQGRCKRCIKLDKVTK